MPVNAEPVTLERALSDALLLSRKYGGSPAYVGQDEDGDIFVTEDDNDIRAFRWLAEVSALRGTLEN